MNKRFKIFGLLAVLSLSVNACAASNPTAAPATNAPIATDAAPTATTTAPTNLSEPTATHVVLGVVPGRIVFQSNRDGNDEIYVMNGNGSGLTKLTNNPPDELSADWKP